MKDVVTDASVFNISTDDDGYGAIGFEDVFDLFHPIDCPLWVVFFGD